MGTIKMKVVSKTMNCIVTKDDEGGIVIIPENQVEGTEVKEVKKIEEGAIPITLVNEIREANLAKFRLKISVKKPKEGDHVICEVQYLVKDE